jgi:ubiquinone/menaquinone biosynthesis C-methylase UbiE
MTTNIGYWEKVLQNPTPSYKQLFAAENQYLTTHIPKNSSVLDVGCGDGTTIQTILPITSDIVGIDNDTRAVEDAQLKLSSAPNVKIVLADALKLPFEDKAFDVVIHMMTLVNFERNKVKVLQEMSRVLKDNGKIIISVYSEHAFPARLEMYKQLGIPIEKIEGTTVIFDKSVGANESEQFTQKELELLTEQASLKIRACQKVGDLAYLCELTK